MTFNIFEKINMSAKAPIGIKIAENFISACLATRFSKY